MDYDEDELSPEDRSLLEVAADAADRAAEIHREAELDADEEWVDKTRADFVTRVDLEAERAVQRAILERFPDHAIVAEEAETGSGERVGGGEDAPVHWIVDPLDGTTNWLHGYPEYAASVAAEDDEGLRVACVVNSACGERFTAVRGAGARRDGQPIRVSAADDLGLALVGTGFPFKKLDHLDAYMDVFRRVLTGTAGIRRAGAAALDLCDVACGRLDAFWELW
ncbi:MAG: inositol monophosphatase family protein, partial [Gemmatimonadota bacterium]